MDYIQIVNGGAAGAAAVLWGMSIPGSIRLGLKWTMHLELACLAVCMWYAVVNLLLGFGVWDLSTLGSVPFFRYAFSVVVLAPALRMVSVRKVRAELATFLVEADEEDLRR